MQKYTIVKEELRTPLNFNFCNIESSIIPVTINGDKKILKIFKRNHNFLDIKWQVLEYFDQVRKFFDERFILPEMIAVTDKQIGYIMRYVNNINLETLLASNNIPFSEKLKCLKEMCLLLKDCEKLRHHEQLSNFYIGDLHVNNLLYNLDTGHINLCDMDSCMIGCSNPQVYRYLSCSKGILDLPRKYPNIGGKFIPNENSDIYCAIMIIMNYLYAGPVEMMDRDAFYKYLYYLDTLKENGMRLFDKNLLYAFSRVYENGDNINPYPYLDTISCKSLIKANNVSYYYSKIKSY